MSAEQAITALVKNTPAITAVIGANPVRWYPMVIPQGSALPAVAYQRISTPRVRNLKATSNLSYPRFQLTISAKTVAELSTVARVLRETLEGFSGMAGTYRIDRIVYDDERDDTEPAAEELRRLIDIFVWLPDP